MKVGFIGTGIMGKPMAINLAKAGVDLCINDLNPASIEAVVANGAKFKTLEEIGRECGVIFTMLPTSDAVKEVIFGDNGIRPHAGQLICDMSSVTAVDSRYCFNKLAEMGVGFVDAPVSGGEPKAIDGTLSIMAGGNKQDFDALVPYFNIMGSSSVLVGDSGCGSIAKLTNQVLVNMTIATIGEAFVLAKKAGADPEKVYKAIRGGLAGSVALDAKMPMILERNFKPGGKISINHKDIRNVMSTAESMNLEMPFTTKLKEIMEWMDANGYTNDDHSGLVKYFENLAGETIE